MAKILIVEDNQGTNKAICEYMKEAGHTLFSAFTGSEALKIFREKELDIIVLDIMLPEMSGIVVLHEIRKISNIPVIMLTAKGEVFDKVLALELGADDYMVKPFDPKELLARVKAVTRRYSPEVKNNDVIKFSDLTIDIGGYEVIYRDNMVKLAPKELE